MVEHSSPPPKHLLIVDDEPVILQVLHAVFEDEPYRVTCVGSGSEARQVIEEQGCDLLLTDKNLPDIGGLELLRLAKARDPHTEVIIITGYASLETALQAIELDAFDYVLKPLNNVFDIRRKVQQALDRRQMTLENQRLLNHLQEKNAALVKALDKAQELQTELIQSEKLAGIGTLAAGIAHEVSSPLFGIMGLAEAITEEPDLELARQYATDIVEYCRHIRDIVVELSSYSRAAKDEYLAELDLREVIQDALLLVQRSAAVSDVEFDIQLDQPLPVRLRTNEAVQIFVNLLKNAAEAVQQAQVSPRRVRVLGQRADGQIQVQVSDNGVGIPADKVGIIFDPFYTTKPAGSGTGLGLNVVYRILTKYRGTITVESQPGQGTVFHLRFPEDA